MKTHSITFKYFIAFSVLIIQGMISGNINAQKTDCVQCGDNINTGQYSTTLGQNITASDFASFASGYEVLSTNAFSFAHGSFLTASGANSLAIGSFAIAEKSSSMVIGVGFNNDNRLKNDITNSLMIGFGSNVPTFFIEGYHGINRTGRIGIGNVTAPQAKLHIRADENYDTASVFIQAFNDNKPAYLWMGNKNFGLQKQDNALAFLSDGDYLFNQGNTGFGTDEPQAKVQVKDGDIFIEDINRGIIMKSPDGNCWRGTVSNQGQMQFIQIDCQTLETGINNPKPSDSDRVKIFPNPAGNQVFISFDETLGKLQLEISDINGRLISSQKLLNAESAIEFATFQSGTYLFRLTDKTGNQVAAKKVIKE
jgi:hypothetical protein